MYDLQGPCAQLCEIDGEDDSQSIDRITGSPPLPTNVRGVAAKMPERQAWPGFLRDNYLASGVGSSKDGRTSFDLCISEERLMCAK